MNQKIKIWTLAVGMLMICLGAAFADKKEDYQKTYNYQRGIELVNEEKEDEALTYFKKELQDHKDNGYAMAWIASVYYGKEEYGEAIKTLNQAMKNLDKKDEMYAYCLTLRSRVYFKLEEKDKALAELNTLVKMFPKRADSYQERAEYYLDFDQYERANADFEKVIEIEPGEPVAYVGSGVCLRSLKRYEESVEKYSYALKLDSRYAQAYAQRALSYIKLRKYPEAAEDIVTALDGNNSMAYSLLSEMADSAFETMDFKLKMRQMMEPNNNYWPYLRGQVMECAKKYKDAIAMFEASNNLQYSSAAKQRISEILYELGDYEHALESIDEALAVDSTDVDLRMCRGKILDEMGRSEEAIAEYTHITELAPDNAFAYHKRGWVKDNMGDTDGAIEDYTFSIMIDPKYVYNYLSRGNMYERKGMKDLAKKDFEEVLKRDTIPSEYEGAFYAWLYLGDTEKAVAAMDSVLAADSLGNYYDAACLYSRMNETDKALGYLEKALEAGMRRFHHIERDDDLDNIRGTERYATLLEEYKAKAMADGYVVREAADGEEGEMQVVVEEIPFTYEGGVTKVKCTINDLPLYFVFDTGAADVTISSLEANFMLKNGYLSERDITGKQYYQTADGNISEGTTIILRKVNFAGLELTDVKASVVKSQKAPLLLGQSVLQRLGKIEIDNARSILKVTHKVQKK